MSNSNSDTANAFMVIPLISGGTLRYDDTWEAIIKDLQDLHKLGGCKGVACTASSALVFYTAGMPAKEKQYEKRYPVVVANCNKR